MSNNADDIKSEPLILRSPKLVERLAHVFGIHAWEPLSGPGRTREYCVGCHQQRGAIGRQRPPAEFPSPAQSSTPEEEPATVRFPPREETRDPLQPRRQGQRTTQGDLATAWQWIVGLRLWVKIAAGFIALQVIGSIVSLISKG